MIVLSASVKKAAERGGVEEWFAWHWVLGDLAAAACSKPFDLPEAVCQATLAVIAKKDNANLQ